MSIVLLSLLSALLMANDIVIHEINKIENISLRNGSSITQGGVTIIKNKSLIKRKKRREQNTTISQGVITIEDNNFTNVHYNIINIIQKSP